MELGTRRSALRKRSATTCGGSPCASSTAVPTTTRRSIPSSPTTPVEPVQPKPTLKTPRGDARCRRLAIRCRRGAAPPVGRGPGNAHRRPGQRRAHGDGAHPGWPLCHGRPEGESDERPLSVVEIKRPFWMSKCRSDQRAVPAIRSRARQPLRAQGIVEFQRGAPRLAAESPAPTGGPRLATRGPRLLPVAVAEDRASRPICPPRRSGSMPAAPGRAGRSSTAIWIATSRRLPTWPTRPSSSWPTIPTAGTRWTWCRGKRAGTTMPW